MKSLLMALFFVANTASADSFVNYMYGGDWQGEHVLIQYIESHGKPMLAVSVASHFSEELDLQKNDILMNWTQALPSVPVGSVSYDRHLRHVEILKKEAKDQLILFTLNLVCMSNGGITLSCEDQGSAAKLVLRLESGEFPTSGTMDADLRLISVSAQ